MIDHDALVQEPVMIVSVFATASSVSMRTVAAASTQKLHKTNLPH